MDIGKWYSYTGTPSSSTSSHKAGIDIMVVSQNQINNTSLVRVRPWGIKLSGSTFNLSQQTLTVKVNNSSKTSKTTYDFREASTDDKFYLTSGYPFKRHSGSGSLVSGAYVYDFTVTHNDDGSKNNVPVYALIPFYNSASGRNWTVDIDIDLPKIPRANAVTYSYTTIGNPITININKSSSSFTTTLSIAFSVEGTEDKFADKNIAEKTSATQVIYNMEESFKNTLLSLNKSSQKVTALLTVYTYSGDDLLAIKQYTFVVPLENTPPIVSATYEDTNATTIALTGNSSKIVKYISKPKVTITAQAQQQADISSYSTVWGNSSSTAQETTFSSGIDSNILNVSAKDSRNWVGNISYDITENYIEYIKLGFEKFTLERPETTSNTLNANLNGVWFNGNFGVSTNTIELKFRYKEKNGEYGEYQTITLTTDGNTFSYSGSIGDVYNYQKQYDFEFILSDKVMSLISTFNVTNGESIIRVAETYVRILGDLRVSGNLNVAGDFTINERNVYPNQNIICVTNSALYELTQTNVYEQIQYLVVENQLGSDLSLVDNAVVIGKGISKVLVNFSLTYDGVGGVGGKYIRLCKNEVDNGYRMVSKSTFSTSGTQNYRIFMNSGDVLIDVVKGDKIMLFAYGTAGDTISRNTYNYFIFTVRAVA